MRYWVLAGDIDAKAAKPLVNKWFGAIPRGKPIPELNPELPTLDAPVYEVMKDKVATTRIYRNWTVPGLNDPDYTPLDVGMTVLGGLASSPAGQYHGPRREKCGCGVRLCDPVCAW